MNLGKASKRITGSFIPLSPLAENQLGTYPPYLSVFLLVSHFPVEKNWLFCGEIFMENHWKPVSFPSDYCGWSDVQLML